ncbi:hypothetical protein QTJ16_001346 [Diplocarpon rosae]|uniref:Uncharacterized protein n=1 Tax=Diplocarpon rosae TaxID=946125 RepID=A0AAD9WHX8_9HELO|nr:hypothetical protein QTJ16_001346 [Diplocarpon rosae]
MAAQGFERVCLPVSGSESTVLPQINLPVTPCSTKELHATVMLTDRSHDIEIELFDRRTYSLGSISSSPGISSLDTSREEDKDDGTCPRPDYNSTSSVSEEVGRDSGSMKSCGSETSRAKYHIDRPVSGSELPKSKPPWSDPSKRQIKGAIVGGKAPYSIPSYGEREGESHHRAVSLQMAKCCVVAGGIMAESKQNSDQSPRGKHSVNLLRARDHGKHEVTNVPSIEVEAPSREALPLKAVTKADREKSPALSPIGATQETHPSQPRRQRSVLDRFGRKVWLHYNSEEKIDEVRLDEDGNYYVHGDAGLRIKLASGQVRDDNTSQPYCVSNGHRINIKVVPDLIRKSMLRGRKAASADANIVPNTQLVPGKKKPPPIPPSGSVSVSGKQTHASSSRSQATTSAPGPETTISRGTADKSKHGKSYSTMSGGSTTSISASVRMENEKRLRRAKRKASLIQAPKKFVRMIIRKGA